MISETPPYALRQLLGYFLRLGTLGFGGPVALVGAMERDLVQRRGWITGEDFKQGLTLAQKLARRTLGQDTLLWGIFAVVAVVTIWLETELAILFLAGGALVLFLRTEPWRRMQMGMWMPFASLAPSIPVADAAGLGGLALFFAKAGAFVFGSGLAIVPFLYGGLVKEHHWLTERQFLDAVAVAMITPGPVVITVGFVGYLVAGLPGACVAAAATFLPCYLFTVIPAPYLRKHGAHPSVKAFVDGVTAAATGAIVGAVVVLGRRSIRDWTTAAIALVSLGLLWRFKKLPEPLLILAAGLAGLLLHPGGAR